MIRTDVSRAAALAVALLFARPALADEAAAARALFTEARELMSRGEHEAACPKLEEAMRLDLGPGTEFNLATCYEATGRIASAWTRYLDVAASTRALGQYEREQVARENAARLEARLARVEIAVSEDVEGLVIRRGAVVVGKPAWSTAVPVDPGRYEIVATAPRKRTWRVEIAVAEANTVRVDVPPLEDDAPLVAPAASPRPPPRAQRPVTAPDAPPSKASRVVGFSLVGAGLATVGVGAFFAVRSLGAKSDAEPHCDVSGCDERGAELRGDARRFGDVATWTILAGTALGAAGAVVLLATPSGKRTVTMTPSHGGIVVRGEL